MDSNQAGNNKYLISLWEKVIGYDKLEYYYIYIKI